MDLIFLDNYEENDIILSLVDFFCDLNGPCTTTSDNQDQ